MRPRGAGLNLTVQQTERLVRQTYHYTTYLNANAESIPYLKFVFVAEVTNRPTALP